MFDFLKTYGFLPECDLCGSKDVENEYPSEPEEIICGSCLVNIL
jgi:hypothetical protein